MKTLLPTRASRPGFTLTEVMVTVAIIATLAGIGVPLIRSSIKASHKAACVSNLRQIGMGLEAYLQDHHQTMPMIAAGRRSRAEDIPVLETVLAPYLETVEVFRCPADPEEFEKSGSSYLWNHTQSGQRKHQLSFFGEDRDPSRIPLVIDKEAWHGEGDLGSNFLYADYSASNRIRFAVSP